MLFRGVWSGLTLYMLVILVRWAAPFLELDLRSRRLRWISRATDPLFDWLRGLLRLVGSLGPMDFTPLAALFLVWLVRAMAWGLLVEG